MGANAQTSVPTFTAGEVLTAVNQNLSAGTGVPVFATTATRDAAFGGAGEKVLAEGQLAYIEASNVVQYYDGAVWATVGPSTGGGLVFLTGATFTTATSFSLPANTFSATYENYKVIVNVTGVTSDADFTVRLRASGSDNTTSNYLFGLSGFTNTASTSNSGANSQTSWSFGESDTTTRNAHVFDLFRPQTATTTAAIGGYMCLLKDGSATVFRSGGWFFNAATQFDSLSFISSVASSMTGNYKVYGYANS